MKKFALSRLKTIVFTSIVLLTLSASPLWGQRPDTTVVYPFTDDFENGIEVWEVTGTWGLTTDQAHSGTHSITDSPDGNYNNNENKTATLSIDLSQASSPVLMFWHMYSLADDFGKVNISTDGSNWTEIWSTTGTENYWNLERLNLKEYAYYSEVHIQFNLVTNSAIVSDGWYIDDVNIDEGTTVADYPFFDDMEIGDGGVWFFGSPWGYSETHAHSGTLSLADSPIGSYNPNTNTTVELSIDLSIAFMPVLKFWQKSILESDVDYGKIYIINADGDSTFVSFITGTRVWYEERIDLTEWTGQIITIKFNFTSDGSNQYDGWYIDDVSIDETDVELTYPFIDDMESAETSQNWFSSCWELITDTYNSPTHSWTDSPDGDIPFTNIYATLTMGNVIDLTQAVNPILTFYHKADLFNWWGSYPTHYGRADAYVEVSSSNGQSGTYETLVSYNTDINNWTFVQVDLSNYIGLSIRIRFRLTASVLDAQINGWWIDDVCIAGDESTIEGNVTLSGGTCNVEDVEVTANGVTVHPCSNGNYIMVINPGIYDVTASLAGYADSTIAGVEVFEGQYTTEIDFVLYQIITADFFAYQTTIVAGTEIQFIDLSTPPDSIISWQWDFDNNGTIDSYIQNPTWTYNDTGLYSISLTVSDGSNTDTEIKENYITVNPPSFSGPTWHISTTGSDSLGNGSLQYPFATIQYGIDSSVNGDTVLVQPGTYYENINFNGKNIVVGSLMLTTGDEYYINTTIINGNHNGSVVTIESYEDSLAILNGFKLTNGFHWGGGIAVSHANPILKNLIVTGNTAPMTCGGGISLQYASPTIINVTISNNIAYDNNFANGGGIHCGVDSYPNLTNVTISGNSCDRYGGGINFSGGVDSLITCKNVKIFNNTAPYGSGIYWESSDNIHLINSEVCNNSDDGIYVHYGTPIIINSIITDNAGYGIYGSGNISITYSDIWNNNSGNFYNCGNYVGINITTNSNGDSCDVYNNIRLDPLFNGNYNLTGNSPCIDAGDPTSPLDPDGSRADMGANYFDQSINLYAQFSSDIRVGEALLTVNFYDNTIIQPVSWEWDFDNDGTIDSYIQNPQWYYTIRGTYTVSLTVFDGTNQDTEIKVNYISLLNSAPFIQNPLIDFSFYEDTLDTSIDLFSVFDDPDLPYGDSLSFTYSGNDSILIDITNGIVTLTPLPDWFGSENIFFTAFDDSLVSISDDLLVTIINVNDPPEIDFPDYFSFYEDSLETYDFTQYITDIDNSLNELSLTWSGNDTINIIQDGWDITFSSNVQNWNGIEEVTFFVNDNTEDNYAKDFSEKEKLKMNCADDVVSETIDVICLPVNDPPTIILPDYFPFAEDSTLVEDFALYIGDVDLDDLTLEVYGNDNIFVDIEGTIVTFSAGQDWFGNEMITFIVNDNQTDLTASDSVDVIVSPVNDPPILNIVGTFEADEDTVSQTYDFEPFCTQTWGETDVLTLTADNSVHINVTINNFYVTFESNTQDWFGTEDITFYLDDNVNDSRNRDIVSQLISVTINPINDPPILNIVGTFEADEDSVSQTYNFAPFCTQTWGENDVLTLSADNSEHIDVTIIDFYVTFESDSLNWFGIEDITFYLDDNVNDSRNRDIVSQTIPVTINPVNDPPVIILPDEFEFPEDSTLIVDFELESYISDVDGDDLTLYVNGNTDVTVDIDGVVVTFGATPDWFGTETLYFTVDDNQTDATASDSVDVIVTPVNDPPMLNIVGTFEADEDSVSQTYNFLPFCTQTWGENDVLTLTADNSEHIDVTINGMDVIFESNTQDWFGIEDITFYLDDNVNDSRNRDIVSQIIQVTFNPINDPPILSIVGTFEADEDTVSQTYNFAPFCTQTWGENDVLTLTADNSVHIDVTINDFDVTFESNTPDWFGTEDITFYLDDNVNDSRNRDIVSQTIPVTINPINDSPYFTSIPDTLTWEDDVYYYTVTAADIDEDSLSFNAPLIPEWLYFVSVIGLLTGIPKNDEVGYHDITLTVTDNIIINPIEQSFILEVENVNDPPVIILPESFSFQQYSSETYDFTGYVWDVDNTYEELLLTWFGNDNIEVAFDDWLVTFSSNTPEWTGSEDITFTVDDGENVVISRSTDKTKSSLKNTKRILQPDRDEVSDMVTVFCEEVETEEVLIPTKTELCGNYPNPFNPETIISFGLKEDSRVTLHIFNIKGQLVTTLLNENVIAGYHTIEWNAKYMSSGIYFYKLNVNGKTEAVKKCLLLK